MPPPEKTATRAKPRARSNDKSRWPLLVIKFDGDATDEEYAASLAERTLLLFQRQKYCVLLDGTTCGAMPASQRKLEADWTREHHALLAQFLVGIVFVSSSPLLRAALTAILWLQPFAWPHTIVSTLAEAEIWASDRLRAVGLRAGPGLPLKMR